MPILKRDAYINCSYLCSMQMDFALGYRYLGIEVIKISNCACNCRQKDDNRRHLLILLQQKKLLLKGMLVYSNTEVDVKEEGE